MKKKYRLKSVWGIALFYLEILVITLLYVNSIK